MSCRFVDSTLMIKTNCVITFYMCPIGLRCGDCEGCWGTENSVSNSRNQTRHLLLLEVRYAGAFKRVFVDTKRPKPARPLIQDMLDACFRFFYAKLWLYLMLQSAFLIGVAHGVIFCCCRKSTSRFAMLCYHTCYYIHLISNEVLVEVLFLLS